MNKKVIVLVVLALLCVSQSSFGLITGAHGNRPFEHPGLPEGSIGGANLDYRLGWWEGPPLGGGNIIWEQVKVPARFGPHQP